MKIKPILFNTDMVRAILEDRKTVTRRVVKPQPKKEVDKIALERFHKPYSPGDILYVRETWTQDGDVFRYKAGFYDQNRRWHPSIHMPREAARIFLRVTDVRVERLQTIMDDPPGPENQIVKEGCKYGCDFIATWERTIKPADRALYGWVANPWVWVIEFERCEKLEEKVEPC